VHVDVRLCDTVDAENDAAAVCVVCERWFAAATPAATRAAAAIVAGTAVRALSIGATP